MVRKANERKAIVEFVQDIFLEIFSNLKERDIMGVSSLRNIEKEKSSLSNMDLCTGFYP